MDHSRPFSFHGSEKEFSQIYSNFSITARESLNLKDFTQLDAMFADSFSDPRFHQHEALILPSKPNVSLQLSSCKKKIKTESNSNPEMKKFLLGDKTEKNNSQDADLEEDDWNHTVEQDSNQESVESGKKRGKYKVYTPREKATILNFLKEYGIDKTLEVFSNTTYQVTKRKLQSWISNYDKIKKDKGRKSNDPTRDRKIYDWFLAFTKEFNRAPTREETKKQALELSGDPNFQASKGWLDKFSRKYLIEFTPFKLVHSKKAKLNEQLNSNFDIELNEHSLNHIIHNYYQRKESQERNFFNKPELTNEVSNSCPIITNYQHQKVETDQSYNQNNSKTNIALLNEAKRKDSLQIFNSFKNPLKLEQDFKCLLEDSLILDDQQLEDLMRQQQQQSPKNNFWDMETCEAISFVQKKVETNFSFC